MSWRDYLALWILGLCAVLVVAVFQSVPGYMDAEYYFSGGLQLADGHGFNEQFLWNFLDDPGGLPHPSHTYWMPLASILAYLGMKFTGSQAFAAGRSGFLLVAAFVPLLTAALAYRLSARRDAAWLAGLLAVLAAFYLPYLPTSDTFAIYMLLGASWLWLVAGYPLGSGRLRLEGRRYFYLSAFLLGAVSGLMHLSRADGILWIVLGLASIFFWRAQWNVPDRDVADPGGRVISGAYSTAVRLGLCLTGYLLVMGPWFGRNLVAFGSLLAPGTSRTLWFVDYDDLYAFPASLLTPARWWASGLDQIFRARLWALGQNFQTILAVQGEVILLPLVIWGLWRCRREKIVQLGCLAWFVILVVMTGVFPYAGARGGLFHAGAALQPLFWAAVPVGLEGFVDWGRRKRGWKVDQARRFFQAGTIILAATLSLFIVRSRVVGIDWSRPIWASSSIFYHDLAQEVEALNPGGYETVLINNAPGWFLATGQAAISIPDGGLDELRAAANKFGARYVILEANHPSGLDDLYQHPEAAQGLEYIKSVGGAHFFEIPAR